MKKDASCELCIQNAHRIIPASEVCKKYNSTSASSPAVTVSPYFCHSSPVNFFPSAPQKHGKNEKIEKRRYTFFNHFFDLPRVYFAASQPLVGVSCCFPQGMQQRHICNWTAVELLFPFGHVMQNTIVCLPCLPLLGLSSHKARVPHFLMRNFG